MLESGVLLERELNRRELLIKGCAGVVGGLGLGGLVWGRHAYAVDSLEQELLKQAAPVTTATAHEELTMLPGKARETIRLFFDGVCLDVHSFTSEVCSQGFVERLSACPSESARHELMTLVFEQHVVTAEEILNRIRIIVEEIGTELDRNWARCCTQIADAWGVPLRKHGTALSGDRLGDSVEPAIRQHIERIAGQTMTAINRPGFSSIPGRVGRSALLLFRLAPLAPNVVLPVFLGAALIDVMTPVIGWLLQPNPGDLQRDISKRMALLGNQVGAEFEREVRRRIADLHDWRETALQSVARSKAEASVPWL